MIIVNHEFECLKNQFVCVFNHLHFGGLAFDQIRYNVELSLDVLNFSLLIVVLSQLFEVLVNGRLDD